MGSPSFTRSPGLTRSLERERVGAGAGSGEGYVAREWLGRQDSIMVKGVLTILPHGTPSFFTPQGLGSSSTRRDESLTGKEPGGKVSLPTGRWGMLTTTRDRILEEAARLFTEKGYEATSVQDIAQALGLSKAALYHHFGSKEEILYEISLLALKGLVAAGEEALKIPDPKEALLRFMEGHARYFEENYPFFVTMLQEIKSLSPENRLKTIALRDRHEANLRAILRRGVEKGVFREVDVAGGAGGALHAQLDDPLVPARGAMRAEEVARGYYDLILRGLERGSA